MDLRNMLNPEQGWMFGLCLLVIAAGIAFVRKGASAALGVIVALSFGFPVWPEISISGIEFSLQSTAAIVGLLIFALRTPWEIRSPIVLLDVFVAATVILHVWSDVHHGMAPLSTALFAYGEWAIPYVAGRYAVRQIENLQLLAVCASVALVILGLGGTIEALTKINPWELVFGERPLEGFSLEASRFGFKRAYGTTLHPIYFGTVLLILSPWPIALFAWNRQPGPTQTLATSSGIAAVAGICSSLSRGPFLAIVPMALGVGAIWSRIARVVYAILALGVLSLSVMDTDKLVQTFETMTGETRAKTGIRLDGKQVEVSSTKFRLVLFQVYGPAMMEAGFLGYGSAATSDFPPKVPHLPKTDRAQEALKYVDNAYLLQGLRFGWTGVVLLVGLIAAAAWTGFRLSYDRSLEVIAGSLVSMTLASALVFITVWLAYDFKFEFLWSCGILGGLASSSRDTGVFSRR